MLIGLGCSVLTVMASRTIETEKNRRRDNYINTTYSL